MTLEELKAINWEKAKIEIVFSPSPLSAKETTEAIKNMMEVAFHNGYAQRWNDCRNKRMYGERETPFIRP